MGYIEREAIMQKFADHVERSNNSDFAQVPTWNQAVQIVEDFPAADVRPVVRASWKRIDFKPCGHDYECSLCRWKNDMATKYCPHCGADMREEG